MRRLCQCVTLHHRSSVMFKETSVFAVVRLTWHTVLRHSHPSYRRHYHRPQVEFLSVPNPTPSSELSSCCSMSLSHPLAHARGCHPRHQLPYGLRHLALASCPLPNWMPQIWRVGVHIRCAPGSGIRCLHDGQATIVFLPTVRPAKFITHRYERPFVTLVVIQGVSRL